MKNLQGKNALLTGGSMGLGPHIARLLARNGVNVALAARSLDKLETVAKEVENLGVKTLAIAADVTDEQSRTELVNTVRGNWGKMDILVNNAGVEWVSSFADLTPGDIQAMVNTNLMAPLLLTREILPDMLSAGSGHIVNMSSLGGKKGSPYSTIYAATKAGLIEWTAGLREELRGSGVDASVICPGFVNEAGMFAVYNKKAPGIVGETTPQKVAEAVVQAILENRGEIIVNPGPIKPMRVLDALSPSVGTWILRKFGVYEFYRQQAEENKKSRTG